jgi:hypothetical protein
MKSQSTRHDVLQRVDSLCNAWCERRCLRALRYLLQAWPLTSPLTDGWGGLGIALQNIRAFSRDEITPQELVELEQSIRDVDNIIQRK